MKKQLVNLLMAVTIVDFSIVDLPYKFEKLQVVAHMSDNTDCSLTLNKDEFYEKWSKKEDGKELLTLLKEVCQK